MLRDVFDEDAELYDSARPGYPPALVEALIAGARLSPAGRVLEVGPGTGQLTVPLARAGLRITAVELGPSLAAVARRNLRPFPDAAVEVAAFEEWRPPPGPGFELAVSATAFHWIDPAVRVSRTTAALAPDGMFALVTTHHVAGGSAAFFERVQRCYERWDPGTPPGLRLADEATVVSDVTELEDCEELGPVGIRCFPQEITYTTAAYLDVLRTYSNHRALPPSALGGLLDCVAELIEDRHGGSVTQRYLHELITARRVPPAGRAEGRSRPSR
ncbi:SAM-dependent methyltransferase [Streptomyces populi]|uniref:SAM-dependent methyltransferase n=1 Tax=Streptomyces populi TaxID=2058924 RepID=A0A2I0SM81_9ACTN|nr:class I SAM-dependent methyltransferase [Streptomyces populi]PKT71010.1 SAM-dependent methyltransferase [Streptomyces populi]